MSIFQECPAYGGIPVEGENGPPTFPLELAIAHLTKAMNDPEQKNVCALSMGNAAIKIEWALRGRWLESGKRTSAKTKFVEAHPNLLRAGMSFLTTPRPLLGFKDLLDGLVECKCDFNRQFVRTLHGCSHRDDDPEAKDKRKGYAKLMIHNAANIVSNCIALALSGLTQHKFHNSDAGEKRGGLKQASLKWPQNADDLFPNGLIESIRGLQNWLWDPDAKYARQAAFYGTCAANYSVLDLISRLVIYHEPFAWTLFHRSQGSLITSIPFFYLQDAASFYKSRQCEEFIRTIEIVLNFFDALENYDRLQFSDLISRCGYLFYSWWLRLCEIMAERLEWRKLHQRIYRLATQALEGLKDFLPQDLASRMDFGNLVVPTYTASDRLEEAFVIIARARRAGCLNAECPPSSTSIIHTRLCSRCNVARYCGEKCQKEAWGAQPNPHKGLCELIASLRLQIGRKNWEKMWKVDFTFSDFEELVQEKSLSVEVIQAIGSQILALNAHKDKKMKAYVAYKKENDPKYRNELEEIRQGVNQLLKDATRGKGPIVVNLSPDM